MSTTLVKPAEVERKWYLLDATGKSLGHVAAEAAVLLRGKQKAAALCTQKKIVFSPSTHLCFFQSGLSLA